MSARATGTLGTVRLAGRLVWSAGRVQVVSVAIATVLSSLAVAAQLLIGRHLLNLLTSSDEVGLRELLPSLLALGAVLLVAGVAQIVSGEVGLYLSQLVHRRVTTDILEVAGAVELEAYERPEFHDRLLRAQNDAGGNSTSIVWGLLTIATTVVITIGVTAVLLAVAPVLVPIAVLGYLPIAIVSVRNNRAFYRMQWDLTELDREREYLERVVTDRSTAAEVRAYGVAGTVRDWHAATWRRRLGELRRVVRQRFGRVLAATVVTTLVLIVTLAIALVLAGRRSITVGDAAVAIVGLQQLSGRLRTGGAAFTRVHLGVSFLRDFEDFRRSAPTAGADVVALPPADPQELRAQGISYRYPGSSRDAVDGVDLHVRRGQIVAVVGANGSGKTTLAKLLAGLLPPRSGTIEWDGVDVGRCAPAAVRDRVAVVLQDFAHFQLRVRDVIGLGDTSRLDDIGGIRASAERAGLGDLVAALPDGLDSRLGKSFTGGTDLSIGQWQRLAIARALFRDAPIVIMDEPSASLDPEGESELFDLLHAMCGDRIVVFVSHRFATVRSADLVLVMDGGRVVEHGDHQELMALGGLYRDLFTLQAARFGPAEEGRRA